MTTLPVPQTTSTLFTQNMAVQTSTGTAPSTHNALADVTNVPVSVVPIIAQGTVQPTASIVEDDVGKAVAPTSEVNAPGAGVQGTQGTSPPTSLTSGALNTLSEAVTASSGVAPSQISTTSTAPTSTPVTTSTEPAPISTQQSTSSTSTSTSASSVVPSASTTSTTFEIASSTTHAPAWTSDSWSSSAWSSEWSSSATWDSQWESTVIAPTSSAAWTSESSSAAVFAAQTSRSSPTTSSKSRSVPTTMSSQPEPTSASNTETPSTTSTTSTASGSVGAFDSKDGSGASSTTGSEKGIGGGAIAGIVIALLVVFGVSLFFCLRRKRKSEGGSDRFWSRWFSSSDRPDDDESFNDKYDRREDDAPPYPSVLSQREKPNHQDGDDNASSFYVPSKSTRDRLPIESQVFGAGASPVGRVGQSSWLGSPPLLNNATPVVANYQPQQMPFIPLPHHLPAQQAEYSEPPVQAYLQPVSGPTDIQQGRQSTNPYAYNAAYDSPGNEVLSDNSPVAGKPAAANSRSVRDSIDSYYDSSDAETIGKEARQRHMTSNTAIDSIYSTWGNASTIGEGTNSAVSSSFGGSPWSSSQTSRTVPLRKSTLSKSWKPQDRTSPDEPKTSASIARASSARKDHTSSRQSKEVQLSPLNRPMAAVASTPPAIRGDIGFNSLNAPPMPLGWSNY